MSIKIVEKEERMNTTIKVIEVVLWCVIAGFLYCFIHALLATTFKRCILPLVKCEFCRGLGGRHCVWNVTWRKEK
jgi:hypothetical protein